MEGHQNVFVLRMRERGLIKLDGLNDCSTSRLTQPSQCLGLFFSLQRVTIKGLSLHSNFISIY